MPSRTPATTAFSVNSATSWDLGTAASLLQQERQRCLGYHLEVMDLELTMDQILAHFGASASLLSADQKHALDIDGFLVLPGTIDAAWLEGLRSAFDAASRAAGE